MGGTTNVKSNLFAASILSCALVGIGSAQEAATSPDTSAHYTKAQVKQFSARRSFAGSIPGSRRLLWRAAEELSKTSRGREAGVGSAEPEHSGRGRQVPKASGFGTQSLRI